MNSLEMNATDTHVTQYDIETMRSSGSGETKVIDVSAAATARRVFSRPRAVAALPDPSLCESIADLTDSLTVGRRVARTT